MERGTFKMTKIDYLEARASVVREMINTLTTATPHPSLGISSSDISKKIYFLTVELEEIRFQIKHLKELSND